MEKKYLKKVLKGLSIAGLVAGVTGVAMGAGGWSGTKKGAVSTQAKQEAPAPGYGAEAAKETAPGYGTPAPGYGEEKKEAAAGYGTQAPGYDSEKKEGAPGYGTPAPGYGGEKKEAAPGYAK